MNVVRVKAGVQFATIAPGGFEILAALNDLAMTLGRDVEITSGTDFHTAPDPHARGEAYDVSVAGWPVDDIVDVKHELQNMLGVLFSVLYEVPHPPTDPALAAIAYVNPHATAPHLHIQVKTGATFPPAAAAYA